MKKDGHSVTLSSGRKFFIPSSINTLSPMTNTELLYGYDGGIDFAEYGDESPLTQEERDEIADHMIELWTKWKNCQLEED